MTIKAYEILAGCGRFGFQTLEIHMNKNKHTSIRVSSQPSDDLRLAVRQWQWRGADATAAACQPPMWKNILSLSAMSDISASQASIYWNAARLTGTGWQDYKNFNYISQLKPNQPNSRNSNQFTQLKPTHATQRNSRNSNHPRFCFFNHVNTWLNGCPACL